MEYGQVSMTRTAAGIIHSIRSEYASIPESCLRCFRRGRSTVNHRSSRLLALRGTSMVKHIILSFALCMTSLPAANALDAPAEPAIVKQSRLRLVASAAWPHTAGWSNDGSRIVSASGNMVIVFDGWTGLELMRLDGHTEEVNSASFSPDGQWIVTACDDRTAQMWDAGTGLALHSLRGHTQEIYSASFSPDGQQIVTVSVDRTARVWDAGTGFALHTLRGHTDEVYSASFSPDGQRIVTASFDGTARVWDSGTGLLLYAMDGHTGSVLSASFSPGGDRIVTASDDPTARVWNAGTGALLHTLVGHTDWVRSASFSPGGDRIVTASLDTTARVWEAGTGRLLHTLEGHTDWVRSASFSPDGDRIVTASGDTTARVWEAATGRLLYTLHGHTDGVSSASFSPDGQRIVTARGFGTARVWDAGRPALLHTLGGHTSSIYSASFSPDARLIVTASNDHTARVWDTGTGVVLHTLEGHTESVSSASFTADGQRIVTASIDGTARVWDAGTGAVLHTLDTDWLWSASFSPDGQRIVTVDYLYGTARVWDAATRIMLLTLDGYRSALFSPDGQQIVTASKYGGDAWVWDAGTGATLHTLEGHNKGVYSASFSPDGQRIVTASDDRTARVWDAGTGETLRTLQGHTSGVSSASFSPDGQRIVTASIDGTVRIWDAETGDILDTLEGHTDSVWSASFSPDGQRVVTVGDDRTVRIWDTTSGRELAQLLSFTDGSWAVIEPGTGRYDAGRDGQSTGETTGLHWVLDNKTVIELEQLKDRYWDPGLLGKLMGHNPEPLREVPPLDKISAFPGVQIDKDPTSAWRPVQLDGTTLTLDLTNDGGGIGAVEVTVDGKPVSRDLRPRSADPDAPSMSLSSDLAATGMLRPGHPNRVEVRAWNKDRTVLSRPSVAIVTPKSEAAPDTPPEVRIHILSVGTSDYLGDTMDLNYAAADARAFAAAMEVAAREFVCPHGNCEDLVQLTTLLADHGGSPDPNARPTRTNILRELNAIADRAGPEDIVIVFFAGHGVTTNATRSDTIDGRSVNTTSESYLYLTPEAGVMSSDALAGLAGQHATVSGAEIAQALASSKARKQLLILDTCGAAGASTSIGTTRSMSGSHLRELDRTASRSGVWLLAGSAADAVSYEASDFGQGVLTYALLEGLLGPGLRDDDYVEITNWLNHANEAVPRLARGIGGIQRPQLIPGFRELDPSAPLRSNAQEGSFAVGRLPAEARAGITLPSPRPVVIRSQLADSRFNRDTLGVSKALDALLQEADLEGHIRFWATDEAADRLTITGVYTRTATGVEVRAQILRLTSPEPTVVGEVPVFTATGSDLKAIGDEIANRLHTVMLESVTSNDYNKDLP